MVEECLDSNLPHVIGDLYSVCSCVENLVTNAIKYSAIDRRIRISAKPETMEGKSKQVAISVEDRGMGIRSFRIEDKYSNRFIGARWRRLPKFRERAWDSRWQGIWQRLWVAVSQSSVNWEREVLLRCTYSRSKRTRTNSQPWALARKR